MASLRAMLTRSCCSTALLIRCNPAREASTGLINRFISKFLFDRVLAAMRRVLLAIEKVNFVLMALGKDPEYKGLSSRVRCRVSI